MDIKESVAENKRLEYIDALKGFAIFLVILGHVIILGRNANIAYSVIYSFHMPLFFILSGFFFKSSLKLKPKDFLLKKSFQLLYPWAFWCILLSIYPYFKYDWPDNYTFLQIGILAFNRWFWFLRDLWLCYVIIYFCYRIFNKGYLVAIFSILFVFLFPFLKIQSFCLPVFLFGIMLKEIYSLLLNYRNQILYISFFIFIFCLFFWKDQYLSMYPSLFSSQSFNYEFPNLCIPLFRWLVGISGSLFFFIFFQKMYSPNKVFSYFNQIGQYTLGIYILQAVLLENLIPLFITFPNVNKWIYSLLITPLISFLVLEICVLILKWTEKSKPIETVLFGKHIYK